MTEITNKIINELYIEFKKAIPYIETHESTSKVKILAERINEAIKECNTFLISPLQLEYQEIYKKVEAQYNKIKKNCFQKKKIN